jgi:hypothetical protein
MLEAQSIGRRDAQAQIEASLIDRTVHISDLILKKSKIEQLSSFKSTKAMQREIVVGGARHPAFSKRVHRGWRA